MTISPEPPPPAAGGPDRQAQKTEFRQNANKFKPNGHLGAEVSVPNVVRKYAFACNFQTLQKKRAATPESTLQTKMKKSNFKSKVCTFMPKRQKETKKETSNVRWTNGTGKH